jgi:hypothetical protein
MPFLRTCIVYFDVKLLLNEKLGFVKHVPGVVCSLFIVLFQLLVNILFLRFAALRNSQKYIFPKLKSLQYTL